MFLSGDEVLHTQKGNNNVYCQDNELSWFDWSLVEKNRDMLRFIKELIALRRRHPNLNRREFLSGEQVSGRVLPDIAWHGYRLDEPLWFDFSAQYLAYTLAGQSDGEEDLHVILNMSERTVEASLPEIPGRLWHLALDTSRMGPDDIMPSNQQKALESSSYQISGRMVAVFEARG
jgi:glycogen operon protein